MARSLSVTLGSSALLALAPFALGAQQAAARSSAGQPSAGQTAAAQAQALPIPVLMILPNGDSVFTTLKPAEKGEKGEKGDKGGRKKKGKEKVIAPEAQSEEKDDAGDQAWETEFMVDNSGDRTHPNRVVAARLRGSH